MAKEFRPLLIIFFSFLISSTLFDISVTTAADDANEVLGPADGFRALDPEDPLVVTIGKFAVDENNKQKKENIRFENVLKAASQQSGAKTEYGLLIKAAENGTSNTYAAVVLDSKDSGKELVGFRKRNLAV
ncbi:uncharacterized protein LOC113766686 [Coffea eugenioides]|uniref:uncharacterized protein LOC113766686 n=1 Tax=Coffea eugenioides TaxID=49369 RepID=UPI000F60E129|nr:uncharacterized protein LOC113766686 [Coffea eugenioides]